MREWSIFKNQTENSLEFNEWGMISDQLRRSDNAPMISPFQTLMIDRWSQSKEKIKTTEFVFALLLNIHSWNADFVEDSNIKTSQHQECTSMKMQSSTKVQIEERAAERVSLSISVEAVGNDYHLILSLNEDINELLQLLNQLSSESKSLQRRIKTGRQ